MNTILTKQMKNKLEVNNKHILFVNIKINIALKINYTNV